MTIHVRKVEAAATPWMAASAMLGPRGPGSGGEAGLFFASQTGRPGTWSILLRRPTVWLEGKGGEYRQGPSMEAVEDPLGWLQAQRRELDEVAEAHETLPFQGGLAGFASFEFGWELEDLGRPPRGEGPAGGEVDLWVGRFDEALVYDHGDKIWWALGQTERAVEELAAWVGGLAGGSAGDGAGSHEAPSSEHKWTYQRGVAAAVEAIYGGAFFEVNYTTLFSGAWRGDRRALYEALERCAPGDYGGVVDLPGLFIASVSPEQFLEVHPSGEVSTRPIKGTRPRGRSEAEDRAWREELLCSEKDRAENVMIVDLMRNDLTRVCQPGTVEVLELCGLHSYSSVHHLVSTVRGTLRDGVDGLDAFFAAFPAGSITGAPKLRVMEWIAENEGARRGPYTGSMFYLSDHGRFDSNVLIRTAVLRGRSVTYGAGGAVVADSEPEREAEEAIWKARPFFEALGCEDPAWPGSEE